MRHLTFAFLGDIVGAPGRRVVTQHLPTLRERSAPEIVVANAENSRSGSGLTPEIYTSLRGLGIDGITLGDHCYRDRRVLEVLARADEPILRPANLAAAAIGRRWIRIPIPGTGRSLFMVTVLGRVMMPLPADDPFACVDGILAEIPERDGIVVVEAHMEATSEKIALARHLDGRVAAVLGTHTHVPTADARVLAGGTAFITDVGMCGPYDSVIGRGADEVLKAMTTGMHTPFPVAEGGEQMCGCVVRIDLQTRRATSIERFGIEADRSRSPFA